MCVCADDLLSRWTEARKKDAPHLHIRDDWTMLFQKSTDPNMQKHRRLVCLVSGQMVVCRYGRPLCDERVMRNNECV